MKKTFSVILICSLILSTAICAFAKSNSVKKGSYTMNYTLTGVKDSNAGATTDSNGATDVIAYVGIFSYKNNTAKNSTSGQDLGYISKFLSSNGGNRFVSYHNLKDDSYRPIGNSLTLELK
ncbi:MAG TPA: hypothetical protein DHV96_07360 [Lachnospiraceae bacterium]|nr:hypothetical protein [Lachnospiraceae bacterium]